MKHFINPDGTYSSPEWKFLSKLFYRLWRDVEHKDPTRANEQYIEAMGQIAEYFKVEA
jgi:hypothetical protein